MAKDYNIAIVGGGIGGLCLAAVISKYDPSLNVTIYEKRANVEAWPNPIAIWKRPWQVLQDIGLEEEMVKRNVPLPKEHEVMLNGSIFRMAGQQSEGYDFHRHMMPYNPSSISRPLLSEILQTRMGRSCAVQSSKKLSHYDASGDGPIRLYFQDGSVAQADVLIGADGVNSATRATLYRSLERETDKITLKTEYEKCIRPVFSGQLAYRCTAPLERIKAEAPNHPCLNGSTIWCGKNKHIVTQVSNEKLSIFMVINPTAASTETEFGGPWVVDVSAEEVIGCFTDWEPDVRSMLEYIERPSRWAMHVAATLPLSVHGSVALLGDSAHAMLSHQGVGGGEVIEDAHLLGRLLSHPDVRLQHIPDVLKVYQDIRLAPAQLAAQRSRENGLMYALIHPDFSLDKNCSKAEVVQLGVAINESFEWLGRGSITESWENARRTLEGIVAEI